jgi:hypothetical protein
MKTKENVMPFARPAASPALGGPPPPGDPPLPPTEMDAKIVSLEEMNSWVLPSFQRAEKLTAKVKEAAAELKTNGGIVSGTILLGKLRGDDATIYLVDGQQRRLACNLSGEKQFYIEYSLKTYVSFIAMAGEFTRANGRLVAFKPDDHLRAFEVTHPHLKKLREDCNFLGYGHAGRNAREGRGSILSMSCALKCWFGSAQESPAVYGQATELVEQLDEIQCQHMTVFLNLAFGAWERDKCHIRMWANLNLLMCMYLYRKLVIEPRGSTLPKGMFRNCLMSVAADSTYSDWLLGRQVYERDRDPCFKRLKRIFLARLAQEYNGKNRFQFPKPEWFVRP